MPTTRANGSARKSAPTPKSAESSATSTPTRGTSRKRAVDADSPDGSTPKKKQKKTSAKERSANDPYNPENNLVDSLSPGLILVMVGLNPGLKTAQTGHAYAHHSNRFWHLLHASGITPKKHLPSETHDLQDLYSIGNTNICDRPTRDGSALSKEELQKGAKMLEEKMRKFRPEAVAIVGKQIWESIWLARTGTKLKPEQFRYGWQDEESWLGRETIHGTNVVWPGARTFVAVSTSGLNASSSPQQKLEVWKPLGEWFTQRRKELSDSTEAAD